VIAKRRISFGIRGLGILAVVLIILSSYALFFYFQNQTLQQVKLQLFEEQKQRQIDSTQQVAGFIGSDLTLVLSILDGISNSKYLQDGQFYGLEAKQLATEKYAQMSETVDRLFILDAQDVVVVGAGNSSSNTIAPLGNDLSFRPWVRETHDTSEPVFSEGFEHLGEYRVIISNPVIDRETKQYLGLVGVSIPTEHFFGHYGNVYDVNSQFLAAFDSKGTILATGADPNLVGLDFFGETTQNFINHDPTLNKHIVELLQGNAGYALFDTGRGRGERLSTSQPIYVAGKPTYFLQVVTPTDTIYSQIGPILSEESGKLALLLAGPTGASAILIIFLVLWNSSLGKEVKKRTKELQESNRLLGVTNEQLRERDRMQNEFINIAAHEMRTPIQPILGLSEIMREKMLNIAKQLQREEKDEVVYEQLQDSSSVRTRSNSMFRSPSLSLSMEKIIPMVEIINRNAKRLEKLTNNLLDVTRIENSNNSLELNKELFAIDSVIRDCIIDISQHIGKKNLKFSYVPADDNQHVMIKADRTRIAQVLMNLLENSLNNSQEGLISVTSTVDPDANSITVSVNDTGSGINPDIIPRLFSKFVTASEKGTGLGLYISKKIIEAHGGKIWAENNKDGEGATFAFTLPLSS